MIVENMIRVSDLRVPIEDALAALRDLGYTQAVVYAPDAGDVLDDDDEVVISTIYVGDLDGVKTMYLGTPESFTKWQKGQVQ